MEQSSLEIGVDFIVQSSEVLKYFVQAIRRDTAWILKGRTDYPVRDPGARVNPTAWRELPVVRRDRKSETSPILYVPWSHHILEKRGPRVRQPFENVGQSARNCLAYLCVVLRGGNGATTTEFKKSMNTDIERKVVATTGASRGPGEAPPKRREMKV